MRDACGCSRGCGLGCGASSACPPLSSRSDAAPVTVVRQNDVKTSAKARMRMLDDARQASMSSLSTSAEPASRRGLGAGCVQFGSHENPGRIVPCSLDRAGASSDVAHRLSLRISLEGNHSG